MASGHDPARDAILEGMSAVKTGNGLMARWHFERTASLNANNAYCWMWLAWTADSPAAAVDVLQRTLQLQPDLELARLGLAWAQGLKEFELESLTEENFIDVGSVDEGVVDADAVAVHDSKTACESDELDSSAITRGEVDAEDASSDADEPTSDEKAARQWVAEESLFEETLLEDGDIVLASPVQDKVDSPAEHIADEVLRENQDPTVAEERDAAEEGAASDQSGGPGEHEGDANRDFELVADSDGNRDVAAYQALLQNEEAAANQELVGECDEAAETLAAAEESAEDFTAGPAISAEQGDETDESAANQDRVVDLDANAINDATDAVAGDADDAPAEQASEAEDVVAHDEPADVQQDEASGVSDLWKDVWGPESSVESAEPADLPDPRDSDHVNDAVEDLPHVVAAASDSDAELASAPDRDVSPPEVTATLDEAGEEQLEDDVTLDEFLESDDASAAKFLDLDSDLARQVKAFLHPGAADDIVIEESATEDDEHASAEPADAEIESAELESAELEAAELEAAELESAELESAELEFAELESAELEAAELEAAELESAELESAELESAELESAELESAELESAELESAELESAELESAELESAELESAELESADYESAAFESSEEEFAVERELQDQPSALLEDFGAEFETLDEALEGNAEFERVGSSWEEEGSGTFTQEEAEFNHPSSDVDNAAAKEQMSGEAHGAATDPQDDDGQCSVGNDDCENEAGEVDLDHADLSSALTWTHPGEDEEMDAPDGDADLSSTNLFEADSAGDCHADLSEDRQHADKNDSDPALRETIDWTDLQRSRRELEEELESNEFDDEVVGEDQAEQGAHEDLEQDEPVASLEADDNLFVVQPDGEQASESTEELAKELETDPADESTPDSIEAADDGPSRPMLEESAHDAEEMTEEEVASNQLAEELQAQLQVHLAETLVAGLNADDDEDAYDDESDDELPHADLYRQLVEARNDDALEEPVSIEPEDFDADLDQHLGAETIPAWGAKPDHAHGDLDDDECDADRQEDIHLDAADDDSGLECDDAILRMMRSATQPHSEIAEDRSDESSTGPFGARRVPAADPRRPRGRPGMVA